MSEKEPEVTLVRFPLKEGKLDRFFEWMKYLNRPENREEILEGIREERIFAESVFLSNENGIYYVYYYMNTGDFAPGNDLVFSGTRPIDVQHFKFFGECIDMENHIKLKALFSVDAMEQ